MLVTMSKRRKRERVEVVCIDLDAARSDCRDRRSIEDLRDAEAREETKLTLVRTHGVAMSECELI